MTETSVPTSARRTPGGESRTRGLLGRAPTVFLAGLGLAVIAAAFAFPAGARGAERPNILWLTSEDNGPHLGCYGDEYADTPHIDGLAKKGTTYLNAWSTAPVCAPARTTLISGLYAPSAGAEHMRSLVRLPAHMKMYPQILREAGYHTSNHTKEDFNLEKTGKIWSESGAKQHWSHRAKGQPFFAIINFTTSHESQVRKRPHDAVHDPARVRVPAYHPDRPEVRRDWAQYYDKITQMDGQVGEALAELDAAGLSDDTIVFYYGDHGAGMPRSKRWPYNSGLRVPLVIHIPEKWKSLRSADYAAGGKTDRLVGFVDFAPTVLSLAGIRPPDYHEGHAFLGAHQAPPSEYLFGFRGRMDERIDCVRSARDRRFVYLRQYQPHRIYGQHIDYMFQTPTTRVWKELYDDGKLNAVQSRFWERKPTEELYDLEADPDEVVNLAASPEHAQTLARLRGALRSHLLRTRDLGFLPEDEIHTRSTGRTPYELAHDASGYPIEKILAAAELSSSAEAREDDLVALLTSMDSAVRYWSATGLLARGPWKDPATVATLKKCLEDESWSARIVAAHALASHGPAETRARALETLLAGASIVERGVYIAILSLDAIDQLGERAAPILDRVRELPRRAPGVHGRLNSYVPRLLEHILGD